MHALAIGGGRELVVRAARNDRHAQLGDALLGQDRAERVGAQHIGLDLHDRRRIGELGAEFFGERLRTRQIDIG